MKKKAVFKVKLKLHIAFIKKNVVLEVKTSKLCLDIKEYVEDRFDIPVVSQKLVFGGTTLKNNAQLGEYFKRKKKIFKVLVLGSIPVTSLKIHVNDIIEYVIGFLPLVDVRTVALVCKKWRELALLGSEFNEYRFCFLLDNRTCYDLLLNKVFYVLKEDIINSHDLQNSFFHSIHTNSLATYKGVKYVLTLEKRKDKTTDRMVKYLKVHQTHSGKLIWEEDVKSFKKHVSPISMKQENFQRMLKLYLEIRNEEKYQVSDKPQQGNQNLDDVDLFLDRIERLRRQVESERRKNQEEELKKKASIMFQKMDIDEYDHFDEVIDAHYCRKYNQIVILFDSYVVSVDANTGKFKHFFDPDYSDFTKYSIFEKSIGLSYSDEYLFIPHKSRIFVVSQEDLSLVQLFDIKRAFDSNTKVHPIISKDRGMLFFALVNEVTHDVLILNDKGVPKKNVKDCVQITKDNMVGEDEFLYYAVNSNENVPMKFIPKSQMLCMYENEDAEIAGYYCIDHPFREYKEDDYLFEKKLNEAKVFRLTSFFKEYKFKWNRQEFKRETIEIIKTGPIWNQPVPDFEIPLDAQGWLHDEKIYVTYFTKGLQKVKKVKQTDWFQKMKETNDVSDRIKLIPNMVNAMGQETSRKNQSSVLKMFFNALCLDASSGVIQYHVRFELPKTGYKVNLKERIFFIHFFGVVRRVVIINQIGNIVHDKKKS